MPKRSTLIPSGGIRRRAIPYGFPISSSASTKIWLTGATTSEAKRNQHTSGAKRNEQASPRAALKERVCELRSVYSDRQIEVSQLNARRITSRRKPVFYKTNPFALPAKATFFSLLT